MQVTIHSTETEPRIVSCSDSSDSERGVASAGAMGQKDQKEKPKTMPGFRYDTTYQRWIRDEKATNGVVTVTTMTGEEYTAWPVCYALLESKGIKSYEVEDVLEMVQARMSESVTGIRLKRRGVSRHPGCHPCSCCATAEGQGHPHRHPP